MKQNSREVSAFNYLSERANRCRKAAMQKRAQRAVTHYNKPAHSPNTRMTPRKRKTMLYISVYRDYYYLRDTTLMTNKKTEYYDKET